MKDVQFTASDWTRTRTALGNYIRQCKREEALSQNDMASAYYARCREEAEAVRNKLDRMDITTKETA